MRWKTFFTAFLKLPMRADQCRIKTSGALPAELATAGRIPKSRTPDVVDHRMIGDCDGIGVFDASVGAKRMR